MIRTLTIAFYDYAWLPSEKRETIDVYYTNWAFSDSVHIGYVKLSNDGRQVRVYDSYGYNVITRYK